MARPREFDEARVIDAARDAFWSAGIEATSISDLCAATGLSEAQLAAPFDTVSVCFSKGLGAPVGSAVAGPRALIDKAHRWRKLLGGGMRQAGVLAAAAVHAVEQHRERLAQDHDHARALAQSLQGCCEVTPPQTNIVNLHLSAPKAAEVVELAAQRGLLLGAMGPDRLRLVTHLDVDRAAVTSAGGTLRKCIEELTP